MNQDLDKKLVEKYPKIFRDRHAPMTHTAMCWGFDHGDGWYNIINQLCGVIQNHIDNTRRNRASALKYNRLLKRALNGDTSPLYRYYTGEDFRKIVIADTERNRKWARERVEADLTKAEFRTIPKACPQVVATQVKEKFGALRFYYSGGDDFVDGVITFAENMSAVTCEMCGKPGKMRYGGWIQTLCDEHAVEAGKTDVIEEYDENQGC
jgi:hypothetical protein